MPRRIVETPCKCGCGQITRNGGYVRGHHTVRRWELVRAIDAQTERNEVIFSRENGRNLNGIQAGEELASRGWLLPDNRRHFGVELEVIAPSLNAVISALRTARVPHSDMQHGYHGNQRGKWTVTRDSSLRANSAQIQRGVTYAVEIVSPPLKGKTGINALRRVMNALEANGVEVNMTCGTHVHHEARDFDLNAFKLLVNNYAAMQTRIDEIMAPSRRSDRNNQYCRPIQGTAQRFVNAATSVAGVQSALGSRYYMLNIGAFASYGTVEFRQHGGTVNAEKLIAWIKTGQAMMRAAKRGIEMNPAEALGDNVAVINGTRDETSQYLNNRVATLARRQA